MLLAGGAAAAFAFASNKDYESTATLVFRQTIAPQLNSIGLIPNTVGGATTSRRTTPSGWPPRQVAADASDDLRARGVDMSADDVQDDVKVVGDKTSDVVKVTASASSGKRAALLANVYAENAQRLAVGRRPAAGRAGAGEPPQAVRRAAHERPEPRVRARAPSSATTCRRCR